VTVIEELEQPLKLRNSLLVQLNSLRLLNTERLVWKDNTVEQSLRKKKRKTAISFREECIMLDRCAGKFFCRHNSNTNVSLQRLVKI